MQLLRALDSFVVVEREGQIIACAALFPFFEDKCGEVAAIAVASDCRGQGQGDKLLGKQTQTSKFAKTLDTSMTHISFFLSNRLHREESFISRAREAVSANNSNSRLVRETRVSRRLNRDDTRNQKAKNQSFKKIKVLHEEVIT